LTKRFISVCFAKVIQKGLGGQQKKTTTNAQTQAFLPHFLQTKNAIRLKLSHFVVQLNYMDIILLVHFFNPFFG
jgi:hypothetical protein